MQATITMPHDGSASDETSTIRLAAGLVTTLLAVAAFLVTQDGGGTKRSSVATTGLILGDHLSVDLEHS